MGNMPTTNVYLPYTWPLCLRIKSQLRGYPNALYSDDESKPEFVARRVSGRIAQTPRQRSRGSFICIAERKDPGSRSFTSIVTVPSMSRTSSDDYVARLARLFLEHPIWIEAAQRISTDATSTIFFSHNPGRAWHLENRDGEILLLPGAAEDPDFVFRFTPPAIQRLEGVDRGMDDFAVELFRLILEAPIDEGVGIRIVAGFPRLLRRGYVRLLLSAGPGVLAFGAGQGVFSLHSLRRLVASTRSPEPMEWETPEDD